MYSEKGLLGHSWGFQKLRKVPNYPNNSVSTGWSLLRSKVTKWITFSPKRFPLHPNLERDDSLFQFISSYETFIYIYLPCDVPSGSSYHQRSWRSPSCVSAARICKAPAVDWSAWRDRRDWPAAQAKYQTQPVGASSALHGIESATAHSIKWSHM